MFVPFVSQRSRLSKRRGGGKSGGGGGGAKGGGSGGSVSGGGLSQKREIRFLGLNARTRSASAYGAGGGKSVVIPAGQLFSGRSQGGGTRQQVWGTSSFGSGYPGIAGRGVVTRGFPFYFWPLSFGVGGTAAYLHSSSEYGHADNTSRPGGVMMSAAFQSNSANATVFRILADNSTVTELITDITANCSSSLSTSNAAVATPYNDSSSDPPQPEQAVQYFRASSIGLFLDGYNNTADLEAEGTPDVPLPSGIDTALLECLNLTIGLAAPLVDDGMRLAPNGPTLLGVVSVIWISSMFM
ncbi:hypothetical protein C8F01DRAFT_1327044 [Mycena amicta]|nr:hypothetical protein C8F01DRAFT_1327044 [Mycena amicta]